MAPSESGGRLVDLTVVQTRAEAELLVSMLREGGLRAMSSADDAGGWGPNVGIEGVRIVVLEEDLDAARALLGGGGEDGPVVPRRDGGRPRPRKRRPS